jgi:archaellin
VDAVIGTVNTTTEEVYSVEASISLAAGGSAIDMRNVIIKYINESIVTTLKFSSSVSNATHFKYSEDRDPSGTGSNVLGPGDLGKITLNLAAMNQNLSTRKEGTIQIIPEVGTLVQKDLIAPPTFEGKSRWTLYP